MRVLLESPPGLREPPGAWIWQTAFALVAIGAMWLLVFLRGLDASTIAIPVVGSAVVFLGWYLSSRDLTRPPSRTEVVVAWCWRVFRALVGIVAAAVFIGGPIVALVRGNLDIRGDGRVAVLLAGIVLGLVALRIGLVGRWRALDTMLKARHRWPL